MSNRDIDRLARESIAAWKRTAERFEREGKHVSADIARQEAWLAEHPEGWLKYIQAEGSK